MTEVVRPAPEHLRALTGLRFIAALWVVGFHAMPRDGVPLPLTRLVDVGYLGVGVFFILSGFILAHVYGDACTDGRLPAWSFLRARFARIYPAYAAALLFSIPLLWHDLQAPGAPKGAELAGVCVATISMTQAWVPGWGCHWNCPGWSLSAEMFFYLSFPVIAPWLLRRSDRTLVIVAAGALAAIGVSGVILADASSTIGLRVPAQLRLLPLSAWTPLVRLPEFVLGICAVRFIPSVARVAGSGQLPLLATGALIAAVAAASRDWGSGLLGAAAIAAPSTVLILLLARPRQRAFLGSALMVRLGNASYSLYLFHGVTHSYFLALANRVVNPIWAQGWTAFAVYLVVVIGISLVVHDWLELPARRALRRGAQAPLAAAW